MLSSLGIQPLLAEGGAEAVALAGKNHLDFIPMDIQMTGLGGFGATRKTRQHEIDNSRARVPVVAYTSITAHTAPLRESGMRGVLHTPCDISTLRECLVRWRASHHRREANLPDRAVTPRC